MLEKVAGTFAFESCGPLISDKVIKTRPHYFGQSQEKVKHRKHQSEVRENKEWCAREDLNLFHSYASFRDSVSTAITPWFSSCLQNSLHADFCALTKFFCHQNVLGC